VFIEEKPLGKKTNSHVSILNPQRQICGRRTFDKSSLCQIKFSNLNQNLMVRIAYAAIFDRSNDAVEMRARRPNVNANV
jgi:hypothetical protein